MNDLTGPRAAWENFYVIIGSAGGALIGLQFVVMTLIADRRHRVSAGSLGAFGTPTVVHLAGALLLSALMSVPWPSVRPLSVALGICGLGGLAYAAVVIGRARRQDVYRPVREDWIFYVAVPSCGYAAVVVSAALLSANIPLALFVIAGAALGLLFVGIHNAWDTVTHIVITGSDDGTIHGRRTH